MKKIILFSGVILVVVVVVNDSWFWNAYAVAFNDGQYRQPITQFSLADSCGGHIAVRDLGPGVFTIFIEASGLAVADGTTKEVKVYINFEDEAHEVVAKGVVYNGMFSAKPFTFSVSFLKSRKIGSQIRCRWESDPSIQKLTFSVRRAY